MLNEEEVKLSRGENVVGSKCRNAAVSLQGLRQAPTTDLHNFKVLYLVIEVPLSRSHNKRVNYILLLSACTYAAKIISKASLDSPRLYAYDSAFFLPSYSEV